MLTFQSMSLILDWQYYILKCFLRIIRIIWSRNSYGWDNLVIAHQIGVSALFTYVRKFPVPTRKKDKNRTATRRKDPPVGKIKLNSQTSDDKWRDCYFGWRHHAMSHFSVFKNFWKLFFKYKNRVLNGEQEKESINRVRWDRKIHHSGSPFVITLKPRDAKRWFSGQICPSPLTLTIYSYNICGPGQRSKWLPCPNTL